jgi:hypothetical protein
MRTLGLLIVVAGALVKATLAFAQTPLPTPPSAAPPQAPECQRGTAPTLGETTGRATLSDQLSQSKGIICPPAGVDPHSSPTGRWRGDASDPTSGRTRWRPVHRPQVT